MLQQIGYATISVANNGVEALDIIEQSGVPDLIFMDIQMYAHFFKKICFYIFLFLCSSYKYLK